MSLALFHDLLYVINVSEGRYKRYLAYFLHLYIEMCNATREVNNHEMAIKRTVNNESSHTNFGEKSCPGKS